MILLIWCMWKNLQVQGRLRQRKITFLCHNVLDSYERARSICCFDHVSLQEVNKVLEESYERVKLFLKKVCPVL